ncbi:MULTISPECIES: acyltransferase [Dyella]|uniref:Acyltransferase n=2 Tax=Dyella TaxID=231454 RepID=A0A4R0YIT5_9GAMM|nr:MULTISPECIES: acyltransferase [Dyella]TBR36546.1 acyltransferase [Dyella terrae]TCI08362.1 acyltransferase [Dyella soli]
MSGHWQDQPEGAGRQGFAVLRWSALHLGRPLMRAILYPLTLFYIMHRRDDRRASRDYLRRVLPQRVRAWHVYRHMHCFAATLLDRIYLLANGERGFVIETEGVDLLVEQVEQGRGVLLIGSHQGSFDALRVLSTRRPDLGLRVVLDKQKTPELTDMLESLAPDIARSIIDASGDGTSMVLAIAEACREGAMVALLADRGREHEVLRHALLLGEPAPFPVSPWLLAHTLRVPVLLCFGLYLGGNRYKLIFEAFAERVEIPRQTRNEALDAVIARYAARVEHYMHVAPYNWFNFYDFWQQDRHASARFGASPVR